MDSKIYLIDADRNHMLGMLSAGGWRNAVEYSPDFSTIYSRETYYSPDHPRSARLFLSFWIVSAGSAIDEVEIPAKRGRVLLIVHTAVVAMMVVLFMCSI